MQLLDNYSLAPPAYVRAPAAGDQIAGANSLHPFRAIPNEILCEIFELCLPSIFEGAEDSLNPFFPPWTITAVCRRWRNIAITAPTLWMELDLIFGTHSNITPRQCAYKAGLYLGRSANLPLTITIVDAPVNIAKHPILPILELTVPRWKRLIMNTTTTMLHCLATSPFSSLSFFEISLYNDFEDTPIVAQEALLPHLRELSITAWYSLRRIAIPWSQLFFLCVYDDVSDEGWNYILRTRSLERLDVRVTTEPPRPVHVFLPKLTELTIREGTEADPDRMACLFNTLALPKLSSLTLEFSQNYRPAPFPRANNNLARLTSLTLALPIGKVAENVPNLLTFLRLTPRLEELRIVDHTKLVAELEAPMKLFEGLLITGDRAKDRVPQLRVLDISRCSYGDSECEEELPVVLDLLYSRRSPGCLQKVKVPRWMYHKEDRRWDCIRKEMQVEYAFTRFDDEDGSDGDEDSDVAMGSEGSDDELM